MRQIILFLFLACSFSAFSQTNHPDGPFKELYENGQTKVEGYYRNNKKFSVWKEYYKGGLLSKQYVYNSQGQLSGINKSYYENGVLKEETVKLNEGGFYVKGYYTSGNIFYEYGKKPLRILEDFYNEGLYREYYDEKGAPLKIEANYTGGFLKGLWRRFYLSGEKEWEVEYSNGAKQGAYRQFYRNGQLRVEGANQKDLKQGEEKRFDETGNLACAGSYVDNDFDGQWFRYNDSGDVIENLKFKKGKLKKGNKEAILVPTKIPDGVFEKPAIFTDCKGLGSAYLQHRCTFGRINRLVFDSLRDELDYYTKKYGNFVSHVYFEVNELGEINNVEVKSTDSNLETEIYNIISGLPIMKSAPNRGEAVKKKYYIPLAITSTLNE